MKTAPTRDNSLRPPTLHQLARRLIRHCGSCVLSADDLIAVARTHLWERRDEIMARPDPPATAYTEARRAMWAAVIRENRLSQLTNAG